MSSILVCFWHWSIRFLDFDFMRPPFRAARMTKGVGLDPSKTTGGPLVYAERYLNTTGIQRKSSTFRLCRPTRGAKQRNKRRNHRTRPKPGKTGKTKSNATRDDQNQHHTQSKIKDIEATAAEDAKDKNDVKRQTKENKNETSMCDQGLTQRTNTKR